MATEPPNVPAPDVPAPAPRGVVLCGIVALAGFVFYQGPSLWEEVGRLREDMVLSRQNAVIGYVGITPNPTTARPPGEWFQLDGESLRLWAGWHPQLGHRWFVARPGDLDRDAISESLGRDLFRGIDAPIVEVGGGPISDRIPGAHDVDAIVHNGRPCAYPTLVLDKVLIVNDEVDGAPLLVLYTRRPGGGSSAFRPVVDGRRIRLGFSGYVYRGRPLLYDRSSEGLWVEEDRGLVSLSGPDRGQVLPRIARMQRLDWRTCKRDHDGVRVLVGADRQAGAVSL